MALGVGLNQGGLAKSLVDTIHFDTWPPIAVIAGSGLICFVMSTFMSNTASTALLVPILAAMATSMQGVLEPFGGAETMILGVAVCASMAMALPISTPPNALAYGTGLISQGVMARIGICVGIVGMILGYTTLIAAVKLGLL